MRGNTAGFFLLNLDSNDDLESFVTFDKQAAAMCCYCFAHGDLVSSFMFIVLGLALSVFLTDNSHELLWP